MGEIREHGLTTDGHRYRTPAHDAMISALGRAMWNLLSREATVVSVLYRGGYKTLAEARALTASQKADSLRGLAKEMTRNGAPHDDVEALRFASDEFRRVVVEFRNALAHAYAFTAGTEDGVYLPGLAHTDTSGTTRRVAHSSDDLHAIAREADAIIECLERARRAATALRSVGAAAGGLDVRPSCHREERTRR